MTEPVLVLAATPRDWAQRLHRHVADHGGARIRATVLTASEALSERYDVLLADDRTSFLSQRLVRRLRGGGRMVIGLYDPMDPQGKSDLVDYEVDDALPADLPPEELIAAAGALVTRRRPHARREAAATPSAPATERTTTTVGPHVVVVTGDRGSGRTEVALGLAAALAGLEPLATRRAERTPARAAAGHAVVVELDEAHACLGPRLGLPAYPNLRAAVDWSRNGERGAAGAVQRAEPGLGALVAGPLPGALAPIPPDDLGTVISDLAGLADWLVVDPGDTPGWLPPRRAQMVVAGTATPVGALRLTALLEARHDPVHLVVNRAPASAYRRWEFLDQLRQAHPPLSLTAVAEDRTVFDAAWRGRPARNGAFGKAMRALAGEVRRQAEAAR